MLYPLRLAPYQHHKSADNNDHEKVHFKEPASDHTTLLIEKEKENGEDYAQTDSMLQFQELSLNGSQNWVIIKLSFCICCIIIGQSLQL